MSCETRSRAGTGPELEDALAAAGGIATLVRTQAEWRAHPQGEILAQLPVVSIEKIAEGEPLEPPPIDQTSRPLGGLHVLDLTRMLAGPVVGRTLAEHGADVLAVNAPAMEQIFATVIDGHPGKRSAAVNLKTRCRGRSPSSIASRRRCVR